MVRFTHRSIADSGSHNYDTNNLVQYLVSRTGKIIHRHVPGAGDLALGEKVAIITAGKQEIERGLDRIEGKPTDTSAACHAPAWDWERG